MLLFASGRLANNAVEDDDVILLGSEKFRTTKPINLDIRGNEMPLKSELKVKKEEIFVGTKRVGFYVLPFIGFQSSQELEWKSVGGNFEIEEKNG